MKHIEFLESGAKGSIHVIPNIGHDIFEPNTTIDKLRNEGIMTGVKYKNCIGFRIYENEIILYELIF